MHCFYLTSVYSFLLTRMAGTNKGAEISAFQVARVVKSPHADAGDIRDEGLIPGSGRYPGRGSGNQL